MTNHIYLDYNATAPMLPDVFEQIKGVMGKPLNASAIHAFGREGRKAIETARQHVENLVGTPSSQIIFNSGATEANNTILNHFKNDRVLISAIEHPSIIDVLPNAEKIPVSPDGIIDLSALETLLKKEKVTLISTMLVNNETGVIQPIADIAKLAKTHGAFVHCDAVQAAGRIPINMQDMNIDFLSLSAHKIGGPQGVGALALGICGITPTLLIGGRQEKSARAGTENIAGIAGFGTAAHIAQTALQNTTATLTPRQEKLEDWLISNQNAVIHGENAPRVPNTTLFSIPGIKAETAMMAMDLDSIAISNGSACSSGTVKPSQTLKAMGATDDEALSSLRISTGWATTENHIDTFIEKFDIFLKRIQK